MKKKTGLFAFSVLLLIGISTFILSCEKDDPQEPDPEASSIQSVSGNSQSAGLGYALTNPIEVVVKDKDGKVFSGTTVSFAVTEGSVSPATAKTDSSGIAKTTWTLGPTEGTQTLIVTAFKADGTTKLTGSPITFTATATQKKASSIELVSGEDQTADAGTILTNFIKILVKDQNGDAFAGATVNFTVTEGSAPAFGITDANGNTYVSWTLGSTAGTQALTVTAFMTDGTTALTGSPITVNATALVNEAASIELVSGEDQTADVETLLANPIKILVKNQNGDAFPGAVVNFTVTEGSVSSGSEITDASGNASVSWTLGSTAGTQALTVTAFKADGTTALTGSPITVNATATVKEAASIELVSGGDQTGLTDAQLRNYIEVIVKDADGNPFPDATVHFSLTEGSVPNNEKVSGVGGTVGTYWTLGPTEGTQTLTITAFKSDGTSPLTGSPLIVNATATGPVAEFIKVDYLGGDDQTGKTNTLLLKPIVIKVFATGGLVFEGETVYFEVSEGSISQPSAITDANGLASISWILGPTIGTQTLTVTCYKADGTTHLDRSPLLVNATAEAENETGTVTDYDGNVYQTIKIDEQWWMAENLKVTHLPDGTAIPKVTGETDWINLGGADKAYCFENNNDDTEYGAFYTRSAALNGDGSSISDPSGIQGVCPDGWHIPSNAEWKVLTDFRNTTVLKEPGTEHWLPPSESNNESGFTAFGAGRRAGYNGTFTELKEAGYWWSSDIYTYNGTGVTFRIGYYGGLDMGSNYGGSFDTGNSVRCVKD